MSRFRPNSPLSSSFSSWEAKPCQNILRKSFKHLQPLDLVRQGGEMSRARPRARLSVAPGFQELVGPADTPSTRRTGYWGPRAPAIPTPLVPDGPRRTPPATGSQGRRPAQVKRLLPATYLLYFGLQVHVYVSEGVSPPVGDITPRIAGASGTVAGTGGDVPGHRRHRRSHLPGTVKLPLPSRLQPACGEGPGTKRPKQPMAAGPLQATANH